MRMKIRELESASSAAVPGTNSNPLPLHPGSNKACRLVHGFVTLKKKKGKNYVLRNDRHQSACFHQSCVLKRFQLENLGFLIGTARNLAR